MGAIYVKNNLHYSLYFKIYFWYGGYRGYIGKKFTIFIKTRQVIMYSNEFQIKPSDPINISNIITYWANVPCNAQFINYWKK